MRIGKISPYQLPNSNCKNLRVNEGPTCSAIWLFGVWALGWLGWWWLAGVGCSVGVGARSSRGEKGHFIFILKLFFYNIYCFFLKRNGFLNISRPNCPSRSNRSLTKLTEIENFSWITSNWNHKDKIDQIETIRTKVIKMTNYNDKKWPFVFILLHGR